MSHAPMYYGAGFVKGADYLKLGLLVSFLNLAVFVGIGSTWWRILGLW